MYVETARDFSSMVSGLQKALVSMACCNVQVIGELAISVVGEVFAVPENDKHVLTSIRGSTFCDWFSDHQRHFKCRVCKHVHYPKP